MLQDLSRFKRKRDCQIARCLWAYAALRVPAFRADKTVHLFGELFDIHNGDNFRLREFRFLIPIKNGSPESGSRSWHVKMNLIQTRQVCTSDGTAKGST